MRLMFQLNNYKTVLRISITSVFFILATTFTFHAQAQISEIFGNRYYSSTITLNDDSVLQVSMFYDTDDNFIVQGMPLINVISKAYGISQFLIVDGPDWIYTPHFYDIKAVPPPSFVESDNDQMLINLLADRFNLITNKTSREMTGLVMEIEEGNHPFEFLSNETALGIKVMPSPDTNTIRLEFSFDALADILSRELNQPVFNLTGLVGTHVVEFDRGPPVNYLMKFAPLTERIGLRLELQDIEVNVLEISNIEPPDIDG